MFTPPHSRRGGVPKKVTLLFEVVAGWGWGWVERVALTKAVPETRDPLQGGRWWDQKQSLGKNHKSEVFVGCRGSLVMGVVSLCPSCEVSATLKVSDFSEWSMTQTTKANLLI